MARTPKAKKLVDIAVTRVDGEYQLRIEDEAGMATVYDADSDQVLKLADTLDDLLADEEQEQGGSPRATG